MRKTAIACVGALLLVGVGLNAEDVKPADSTIRDVTLYADRARVTRVAEVDLPAGSSQVVIAGLPGWIDEGSVRVSLPGAKDALIGEVQVKKEYLAEASEEDVRRAQADVWELQDQLTELHDKIKVLEQKRSAIQDIKAFNMEKLPKDAAMGKLDMDAYEQVVDYIAESLSDIAEAKREIEKAERKLTPQAQVLQKKLNDLKTRARLEKRNILINVQASQPAKATLEVVYMLPGATWEPIHDLRTDENKDMVTLVSYARVSQTTGEDWSNARLSFSTQRPSETIRIPQLDALLVGHNVGQVMQTEQQGKTFQAAYDNFITYNGIWIDQNPEQKRKDIYGNRSRNDEIAQQMIQVFDELQKRGTTAHFYSNARATVRTDGSQVRVKIGEMTVARKENILSAPEASLNAVTIVDLANKGRQPLLPGKVSLYKGSSFLGTTEISFVAESEEFSLFLGVADHLKISRVLDRKASSIDRGRSRTKLHAEYAITIENLSDKESSLDVTDRVPLSDNKDVRLSGVKISPDAEPDSQGIVHWTIKVAAGAKQVLKLKYTVEYPNELTEAAPNSQTSDYNDSSINFQLKSLEKSF